MLYWLYVQLNSPSFFLNILIIHQKFLKWNITYFSAIDFFPFVCHNNTTILRAFRQSWSNSSLHHNTNIHNFKSTKFIKKITWIISDINRVFYSIFSAPNLFSKSQNWLTVLRILCIRILPYVWRKEKILSNHEWSILNTETLILLRDSKQYHTLRENDISTSSSLSANDAQSVSFNCHTKSIIYAPLSIRNETPNFE